MIRTLARLTVVALTLVLGYAAPSAATTVVPVHENDLAAQASAVVLGRVTAMKSHWNPARQQIFTDVTLAVDEVLAGPAMPATLTLRQPGGRVGGLSSWIEGSPEFWIGERVVVFLRTARDGTLRVLHLHQGKFSVMTDPLTGHDVAMRISGGGVRVLAPMRRGAAPPPKDTHALDDLRRAVRAVRPRPAPQAAPMQTAPSVGSDVVGQPDGFTFNGTPARWFEPDTGQAVTMLLNSSGLSGAPTQGFDQVRQGLAAWTNDPQANFRYADGGFTTSAGFRFDGVNAVSWDDPDEAMAPPSNCSGILAMGGFFRSTEESRVVNGTTFMRILEGDVVFNNGWQGCGFYEVFLNLAEVATHELGHVLGLGHSSDADSTMYSSAHFDGRGAALRADDLAGLRSIYPLSPLTVAFTSPAPGATVSGTITVGLTASGGTGAYTFQVRLDGGSVFSGAGTSFPWNTNGVANGGHTLAVTVTDSQGRTATSSISVTVANGGGGGGGTVRVSITQPANGATVSGIPWAVMWVDGTSGTSNTFTLTLAGQTMGASTTSSRGPVSMPYDTRTVANGSQPLTASVRDATGNTGSTTITVTVNNAGAPPPITASFTSPAAGATVTGTVSVGMAVSGSTAASRTFRLSVDTTVVSTQTVGGTTASYPWNTAGVANGAHTLSLTVTDSNGGSSTVTRGVTVQNAGPLTASVTAPANGATVSGTVTMTVAASGGTAPYTYAYAVDGAPVTSAASASFSWNSASVADGAHTLGVTVTDAAGGSISRSVSVTVSNTSPPPPPPGTLKVFITAPSSGATVSGTNWATLWLQGSSGSSNTYTLSVAGQTVATMTTSSTGPVSIPWSTFAVADGPQTLTAAARDATNNTGAASVPITVANGGTPPPAPPPLSASFTSPAAGATVNGSVTVGMAASGGTAPYTYALTIDGTQVASGAAASYSWNTVGYADGSHTLALTVTDSAGRTASASRSVTVSNAAPPPPPPGGTLRVFVTSPPSGSTVRGTVWINVWVEGAAAGNRTFTVTAGGTTVRIQTDSGVHVTFPWDTPTWPNGPTTLSATVQDAAGNSGSQSIPVTVGNW